MCSNANFQVFLAHYVSILSGWNWCVQSLFVSVKMRRHTWSKYRWQVAFVILFLSAHLKHRFLTSLGACVSA